MKPFWYLTSFYIEDMCKEYGEKMTFFNSYLEKVLYSHGHDPDKLTIKESLFFLMFNFFFENKNFLPDKFVYSLEISHGLTLFQAVFFALKEIEQMTNYDKRCCMNIPEWAPNKATRFFYELEDERKEFIDNHFTMKNNP